MFFGIILLSLSIFSACNENISDPQTVDNNQKSLAKNPMELQQLAQYMHQNNMGNGAVFVQPTYSGYGISIGKNLVFDPSTFTFTAGQFASFEGEYGTGDFWRVNPDGTVSVKLTTNSANASHLDIGTTEEYLGTGHMNMSFTGNLVELWPGFFLLIDDPSIKAAVVNCHAKITLNGAGGDSHNLKLYKNLNPGGPGRLDFIFN